MAKGIIYVMKTAVPGLIKIGKTGLDNFEQRMYNLKRNGYCNVTALEKCFAIEVDEYDDKEIMLQKIFEKSRLADTELFALDVNIATQLLSSFEGKVIFPEKETKEEIFDTATDNSNSKLIPDGTYTFKRKKISDNKLIKVTARVINGKWTLLKGSILGVTEDVGVSMKAKEARNSLPINSNGELLEDFNLGECTPSHAGAVVMNQSNNGWSDWKDANGNPVDIYRKRKVKE